MDQDHTLIVLAWIQEHKNEALPADGKVLVRHDLWCASWYSGKCDCKPDIYAADTLISYPLELLKPL